jgi:SAM-dependent methyltransferase
VTAYQPSLPETIDTMLSLAKVGPDDVLYDLGCGDGRIVIAAEKRGATGIGIDADPVRVAESLRNGANAFEGDFLTADFADATVVTMFLEASDHAALLPRLLALKPGTRIVTVGIGFDGWRPTNQAGGVRVFTVAAPYCHAERDEACAICTRYYADPAFRVKIAEATRKLNEPRPKRRKPRPERPATPTKKNLPCANLGGPTGELVECKTCKGTVRLKVLECSARGKCTIEKPVDGVACCRTCTPEQGYRPKP